jgi:voltage-gated potassium channel
MKERLKIIVEREDTRAGRVFNLFIMGLILLSVLSISFETLPGLDPAILRAIVIFEVVVVIIFTIEYIFSFYGIIDVLAIIPFYAKTGIDLRSIRVFRILRAFRILKFSRYSKAATRLLNTFKLIRAELVIIFFILVCLIYLAAIGIYYFESQAQPDEFASVFHSLWWSVSTVTLLGYGDVYPITAGGRIFTFFVLMIGIAMIAVPTGLIASALSKEFEIIPKESSGDD